MADVYDKATRRRVMQCIRKTNTKPEILVRSVLHCLGYRFRLYRKDLVGTPDIVLPKYQIVVFVHGCFWHQHHCHLGKLPKSNESYWFPKLRRNQERDASVEAGLLKMGWRVITIWECETTDRESVRALVVARLGALTPQVGAC
jgi:DNA mismatch endonuclease (patch repair protein)